MNRISLYEPFNEVFPELLRGFVSQHKQKDVEGLTIRVDLNESEKEFVVTAEVPGAKKEDIKIDIDGNRVSISTEVKRESEKKDGDRLLRTERYYGTASRSFALATEVDEANAKAEYQDGILKLTLPKKPGNGSKRLAIS